MKKEGNNCSSVTLFKGNKVSILSNGPEIRWFLIKEKKFLYKGTEVQCSILIYDWEYLIYCTRNSNSLEVSEKQSCEDPNSRLSDQTNCADELTVLCLLNKPDYSKSTYSFICSLLFQPKKISV